MRSLAITSALLALSACESKSAAPETPPPASVPETTVEGEASKSPPKQGHAVEKPDDAHTDKGDKKFDTSPPPANAIDAGRKQFEGFTAKLNAGRKASKAGKYDEAIENFEAALKLRHDHPAVLGELGWAHFKKENFSEAERITRLALERATDPKRRGALFYNLGRALEAQENTEGARAAYTDSLRARPNGTVVQRLTDLPDPPKAPEAAPPTMDEQLGPLCEAAKQLNGCDEADATCSCRVLERKTNPAVGEHLVAAAIFSLEKVYGDDSIINDLYVALETSSAGWQTVGLLQMDYYDDGGRWTETRVSNMRFEAVLGDPQRELLIDTREKGVNDNFEFYCTEKYQRAHQMICSSVDQTGSCARFKTFDRAISAPWPGRESEENQPYDNEWTRKVSLAGDAVVFQESGDGARSEEATHPFTKLGGVYGVTVDGYR